MGDRSNIIEWDKGRESLANVKDFISVYPQNRIGIPKSVYNQLLDRTNGVTLKFSKDTQEIGITPTDDDDPNAYAISEDMRQINCPNFLESFELDTDEAIRHTINEQDEEDGTIWIDISEPRE